MRLRHSIRKEAFKSRNKARVKVQKHLQKLLKKKNKLRRSTKTRWRGSCVTTSEKCRSKSQTSHHKVEEKELCNTEGDEGQ